MILEPFAGPGGWSIALAELGLTNTLGIEKDTDACATAESAGHQRIQADVSMVDLQPYAARVSGLVISPPCQSFSNAGKGLGKLDRPRIEAHIARIRRAGRWLHYSREGWHDPRSPLVLEVLRYVLTLRPEWVALEQVPQVLPLWELMAEVLRAHGHHVDTGNLSAEEYGVPQTRKRALLIASRTHAVALPAPTHRRYRKGVARDAGDQSLLPWVSMADALGWGLPERPSPTITGGGTGSGGAEPIAHWDRYSPDVVMRSSAQSNATVRTIDEPSPTITAGHDRAERCWVAMQSNQRQGDWIENQALATTVSGDPRIAPRGHHDRQMRGAVRVSVQEAAILQSCPADYPWQGSKTSQYQQVGNLVPPLLAKVVLQAALGLTATQECVA